ncbi:GntR family transcriptional regulator [Halotia wernerae UHCC 0503]|jgi:GntR family transcriptional regulator|nr:GntR family transcriptional regulator [Halotia wernerae UHCC 0503]
MKRPFSKLTLDETSPTPLYLQLADAIRTRIADGNIKVGDALPSERELSQTTGISRVTVRKAIDALFREGLLSRRHGSGTYIAPRIEQSAALLAGFSADMASRGKAPGFTVLKHATGLPTPEEALALALGMGAKIVRLSRVRTADGEPLAVERACVPVQFLEGFAPAEGSLYSALEKRGFRPVRGLQRLQASLASPEEASLLGVPPGAAVLRIERRAFLGDGTPVEFTRSAYRGDRYDFVAEARELKRAGS